VSPQCRHSVVVERSCGFDVMCTTSTWDHVAKSLSPDSLRADVLGEATILDSDAGTGTLVY